MVRTKVRSAVEAVRANRVHTSIVGRRSIQGAGVYGIWIGSAILWGGDVRFHGPGLVVISEWARYYVWGYIPIVCGFTILVASIIRNWWVKLVGLGFMAMWTTAFASGAQLAVSISPIVGMTGGPTYYFVTFILAGLIFIKEEPRHAPT